MMTPSSSASHNNNQYQRSSTITYLKQNGCIVRGRTPGAAAAEEDQELTHTLMNGAHGGKISVRESAMDGFFAAYGEDLAKGHKLYVIERRSEVFNMHLDCDFKTILSDDALRVFVETVHGAVAKYFGGPSSAAARCIVCAVMAEDGVSRKAPGIHLMFPFAPVNEDCALWIRSGVVHTLYNSGGLVDDEDWGTVIDISVLTTSGLRMVGSDKCKNCPACHNLPDNRPFCCGPCERRGKVPEDKIYWPAFAWPANDAELQLCLAQAKANPAHAARICSTRRRKGTPLCPTFSIPQGAPPPSTKKRARPGASSSSGDGVMNDDEGRAIDRAFVLINDIPDMPKIKNSRQLQLETKQLNLLVKTVRGYHAAFADIDVKDIQEWKGRSNAKNPTTSIVVKVAGFGSRFCLNKGADHTSQSIYFVVTQFGISQRCFSKKETERKSGLCSAFSSNSKPISAELRAVLFADDMSSSRHQRVPLAPTNDPTDLQLSAAHTADIVSQLPSKLVRMRTKIDPSALAMLEIPCLWG